MDINISALTRPILPPHMELEVLWAGFTGCRNMVSCSSGTAALHLALEALQLPPGSKVIVPNFTMVACARAVVMAGLTPVFMDCDPNGLIDLSLLTEVLEYRKTCGDFSAIMPVHVYGRMVEMDELHKIVRPYNIRVVEDLAEAHGAYPHPKTDASCWSFYKNKIIAGEEGGAVGFRNPLYAHRARQLRSLGFTEEHDFIHVPRGCNYRLADSLASLVMYSLRKSHDNWSKRRALETAYLNACPSEYHTAPRSCPWVLDFRIPNLTVEQQSHLIQTSRKAGALVRHGFKPMSEQPEFRHCTYFSNTQRWAHRLSREVIYFGLDPARHPLDRLTAEQHLDGLRKHTSKSGHPLVS